jgi:hypothetical protein
MGQQFTSLDSLITHAFVQEQKLICRRSAPSITNAQLNNVQGTSNQGHPAAKRARFANPGGHVYTSSERDDGVGCKTAGMSEIQYRIYRLGMEFGLCGGCLGLCGDDEAHLWGKCPKNPKNAQSD